MAIMSIHWVLQAPNQNYLGFSLIETCKLNAVNQHAWQADALTRLVDGWRQSRIDELMPWTYGKAEAA